MFIDKLYFVFAGRLIAQGKYVIISSEPYGSDTISLNKGLQT